MSPPGDKKGPKPFLGEEELTSELDAWDDMFDNLHAGPDESSKELPKAPPSKPPPPSHDETDFSAVGAATDLPAWNEEPEDGKTMILPPDPESVRGPVVPPHGQQWEDDEDIYTSASRPNVRRGDDLAVPEDPLAAPPKPAVRTGPAIIRRTPLSMPAQRPPKLTPQAGYAPSDFDESTKLTDADELAAKQEESRRADARSKAPTAPPPLSFTPAVYDQRAPDDDEYEIEIGAAEPEAEAPPKPTVPKRTRTVANLLRRPVQPTPQAQKIVRAHSEPVIEVSVEHPGPAAEDDFSDVAAAVGASDEGAFDAQLPHRAGMPGMRPPTPPAGSPRARSAPSTGAPDAMIDDHLPTELSASQYEIHPAPDTLDVPVDDIADDLPGPVPTLSARPPRDLYELEVPRDEFEGGVPTLLERTGEGRSMPTTDRPPALMDLYPRVKRPTSVPVMGKGAAFNVERTISADREAMAPLRRAAREDRPAPTYGEPLPEFEPSIDLEAVGPDSQWPEQTQPLTTAELDDDRAASLVIYEREIPTVDDPAASAALRLEAGRLCERLNDVERARAHYDAALLSDPRATAALRGLRRIARAQGDLIEATRHLDAEIAVAGALERRPLAHYRVDLLLACGEYDLARVAVGELLDTAPSDVRALLAQLELAFLDGRADEFGTALEQLAHAVADNQLRAAVQHARSLLAAHNNDPDAAAKWIAAATESYPESIIARLGAVREAAGQQNGEAAARALLELGRMVETSDPATAAAFAVRAQFWNAGEVGQTAAQLAMATLPSDPLVARVTAETALNAGDITTTAVAMTAWANSDAPPAERAYAAARAAELDPGRSAELWNLVLELDPGDDYAAAQLRTAYVGAEQTQLAIEVDLGAAADPERERARLRAAFGLITQGQLDEAIDVLQSGHNERPSSIAMAEALAEALAAAGRWTDRAKLLATVATDPKEQFDREVAQLRSALAWEEAVGAAAAAETVDVEELQHATSAALAAWEKVIEMSSSQGTAPSAHAAAIVLASRIGDREVLGEVLQRAQMAERSAWAASSLALRRARLVAQDEPERADSILNEATPIDDPRRTVTLVLAAARRHDLAEAATTLDERATQIGDTTEAAALRLRAGQLCLDAGDAVRATNLLRRVEQALPGIPTIADLLSSARRRAGDATGPIRVPTEGGTAASADEFARVVRDADDAVARGDGPGALGLYQNALEMRPGDPLAAVPLVRVATQLREPEPIAALAIAQLKAAEAAGDGASKAEAYELLAHIDKGLRSDNGSAQIALESASQADPSRVDLMHMLEREYTVSDQIGELLRLRRAELAQIPVELARDRASMLMDTAGLAERDQRPDAELTELYRSSLEADAKYRLALFHLEAIVRRGGASEELAKLEEQIAEYFEGDARAQAAFYTRAGETLVELNQIDAAVQRFGKADGASPGHAPALEGWRQAALKAQLWVDVAEAATRQASIAGDAQARAALHHFAGVVLMDKALNGEAAQAALRRALEEDPAHRDAFVRLRILLEEEGNHDELAILLEKRLEHEPFGIDLHRALAHLKRNFLSDREGAKAHYREILGNDPNDLRAHAEIADIAWEQGQWQEAADALIARARLEHDPEVLKTLCFRLGLIYADRLVDVPMALKAFQRALTYQPDDEGTLVRLADLATQAGEWKLALGACERLVKSEQDPDKRAYHLHRVARIFRQGFGDLKRAERALNLALDAAPTNDDALAEVVRFYREAGDMTSVRVHLNRVAGTMRIRAQQNPRDGVAYRVISRAMAARAAVGVNGSLAIARAAAELAQLLGSAGEPEHLVLSERMRIDLSMLLRPEADEILFPRTVQPELRQIFSLMGDRVAKHVGVDLRAYGVGRGDRLRARDSSVAANAQDIATGLGFGDIDVYVSARQPYAMAAEPTSPVSLVLGKAIAQGEARTIRFAAGAALKLAQTQLAIPARLPPEDLGILIVALLRLFQTDFPARGLDEAAITTQMQKLKRLIPTGLASEIRPFAYAIDAQAFSYADVSRDLKIAGLRAGLVAAGSLMAGLTILATQAHESAQDQTTSRGDAETMRPTDVPSFLADPLAQGLILFALSEDHAIVAR